MPRALILCHPDMLPPKSASYHKAYNAAWKTEHDVMRVLQSLKWKVQFCTLTDRLKHLQTAVNEFRPHLIINLLEELDSYPELESHIVNYLENSKYRFTGCGSKGLLLSRHKATAKYILKFRHILTPNFNVVYDVRRAKTRLRKVFFPAIIKFANEDASFGIQKSSLVRNYKEAIAQIRKMKKLRKGPILIERFIAGREFHIAAFSRDGKSIKVYKPIETVFTRAKNLRDTIATEEIKWNLKKRRKSKIVLRTISTKEKKLEQALQKATMKAYKALSLKGYARLDVRVDHKDRIYVIDVNPNPDLGQGFELAEILRASGMSYTKLIQQLVRA